MYINKKKKFRDICYVRLYKYYQITLIINYYILSEW